MTEQPPAPPAQAPPKKKTGLIIALAIIGVLILCCCVSGILAAVAIPTFTATQADAKTVACFATQRMIEGAVQEYWAEAQENAMPLTRVEQLARPIDIGGGKSLGPYLDEVPACPADGTYSLDEGRVTCSVHGRYADAASDEQDKDD